MNSIVTNSYPAVAVSDQKSSLRTITLNTLVSELIADLESFPYIVVNADTLATDARKFLKQNRSSLMAVINQNKQFLGILDSRDFDQQEIVKRMSQGYALSEIQVSDLLHPREILHSVNEHEISHQTLMSLLRQMRYSDDKVLLVLTESTGALSGILSAAHIAQQLQLPPQESETLSFRRLYNMLANEEA